ncbi:competence-damaged protein-domain-containing protein [Auriculariales sp. MPI-PUGE-AT-0066]|nr:competence-damaged protein-domain-containing protein [Auriculariales sp. MPI-PUGE-AT-0066]
MSNAPSVVSRLLHTLERLSLPVVTAESCTGGALASALTGRPGAPGLCLGGVTSYSPLFKRAVLGVPASMIRPGGSGEVSAECARAMARGVLERSGLLDRHSHNEFKYGDVAKEAHDIGLSTTGFLDQLPDGEPTGGERQREGRNTLPST